MKYMVLVSGGGVIICSASGAVLLKCMLAAEVIHSTLKLQNPGVAAPVLRYSTATVVMLLSSASCEAF